MDQSSSRSKSQRRLLALAGGLGLATLVSSLVGCGADLDGGGDLQQRSSALRKITDPNDPPLPPLPPPPPPPPPTLAALAARYNNYDLNGDGIHEINSLRSLFPNPEGYATHPAGVVIVLVDTHLVADTPATSIGRLEMQLWMGILSTDLLKEGYYPYFVEADVYAGARDQDGLTVLAMRRFLQTVRQYYPLTGVLLVGSFPDAAIVHRVLVKPRVVADPMHPTDLTSGSTPVFSYTGDMLVLGSELVTPRGEIVLGDLDGNWESLYRASPFNLTDVSIVPQLTPASYPVAGQTIDSTTYQLTMQTFQDVFFIDDAQASASAANGWARLTITSLDEPSPEATAADLQMPNRIARPEILVSRIDARHVAVEPQVSPAVDLDGKTLLAADGKPQPLRFAQPPVITWSRSQTLERRLIEDYIARAHAFRLGNDGALPFHTSAIQGATELLDPVSFNSRLMGSASGFGTPLSVANGSVLDYALWLRQPAVLRGIAAHSDPSNSQFTPMFGPWLADAIGGRPWHWVTSYASGIYSVQPTWETTIIDAGFALYRTMWANGFLAHAGQMFIVHDGCEVNRPAVSQGVPYSDATYGQADTAGDVQNGESLMFYANGLGLMARNKVFNDTPAGFYDSVRTTGRFGAGWRGYFLADASNSNLDERVKDARQVDAGGDGRRFRTLQRKRSYFWNTIGDFTLKLRY